MSRLSIMEKGGCQILAQVLCICFLLGFIIALEKLQITVLVLSFFTSPFREAFECRSDFHDQAMLVASIFQPRKWDLWSSGQKSINEWWKGRWALGGVTAAYIAGQWSQHGHGTGTTVGNSRLWVLAAQMEGGRGVQVRGEQRVQILWVGEVWEKHTLRG